MAEPISNSFLEGVVKSTSTYTEGWRAVAAELLKARRTLESIAETVDRYESGRSTVEDAMSDIEEDLKRGGVRP